MGAWLNGAHRATLTVNASDRAATRRQPLEDPMTQAATETGTGQAAAGGDAGTAGQGGAAAAGATDAGTGAAAGQAAAGATDQGAGGATAGATGTGQAAGTQAAGGADDGLTDEERNALTDPGRRALERIRGERDTHKTELETTRTQLQAALARINEGSDQAAQAQVTEATTARDAAVRQVDQLQAVLRNGLATPQQGETGDQFAARVVQLAGMLQGADQAALDASAAVLASLGGGQQVQRVTTGDTQAAGQGAGQAGQPSMDDLIRRSAGRG